MKQTKSIRTSSWWLLNGLQLTNCSPKKVLVPDIKAAEDLDFGPLKTPAAVSVALSLLHAPHQPSDVAITELIVLSIRQREPKARKPVAAIVVQIMGDFFPEIFQTQFRGRCSAT